MKKLALLFFPFLAQAGPVELVQDASSLRLQHEGAEILRYHLEEVPTPSGVDEVFRRSGVIHPVKTPKGGVLTGIHPDDHYHHIGIWNAWVKTKVGDLEPDFWNLKARTGRVRHAEVIETYENGFKVRQEQLAYEGKDGKKTLERIILRQTLEIRAWAHQDCYVIDHILTQKNVSGMLLELPQHRYGGALAWRGPLDWNADNSNYLTSSGKKRADSHQSRADWCLVHGPTNQGVGSLLFLGHPTNPDAPQRLRTWPDGKMFLNWCPVQEKGTEMRAGDETTYRYRLITYDGIPSEEQLADWWATYRK